MAAELLSVAEAQARIAAALPRFGSERVPLDRADGRILRQAVTAERDLPPYDRVMMDGVAIRHRQPPPAVFQHVGAQLAGMAVGALDGADHCLEVTTGAILPQGADTVIPVEQLVNDGTQVRLAEGYQPQPGQFIHRRGADCRAGDVLMEPGEWLGAPELAVLAANGVAQVEVARVPGIALISTGDELVDVDEPVAPWQIRRSNDRAMAAALRARGLTDLVFDHVRDDLAATVDHLGRLLAQREVLVLSGGVSMGSRDFVPRALTQLGVREVFHRIAQRPGKPMWFGVGAQGQAVFALPGNPVSALACGVRYVLPALLEAQGARPAEPMRVALADAVKTSPDLACFVPVRLHSDATGRCLATPMPAKTSGDFSALTRTDGFVQLPPGPGHFDAGYVAAFFRW